MDSLQHDHGPEEPSPIDRLDPRVRLVSMAIWIALAAWLNEPAALGALLVAAVFLASAFGSGARRLFSRLGPLTLALLPAWIVLPLIGPESDLVRVGPVNLHSSGLVSAAILQARACSILSVVIFHQGNTPWNQWVWAAGRLGTPAALLNLLTITLRYLPILSTEARRTMTAARARGFESRVSGPAYTGLAAIAGSGLVRSYYRSERLVRSMAARGYEGRFHLLEARATGGADLIFILISLATAIILIFFGLRVIA
jgi:cobalt/nickel transport system permease protein